MLAAHYTNNGSHYKQHKKQDIENNTAYEQMNKLLAETKVHKTTFGTFELMWYNTEHREHLSDWLRGADVHRLEHYGANEPLPPLSVLLEGMQPNVCTRLQMPMPTQPHCFDDLPAALFSRVQHMQADIGIPVTDPWMFRQNLRGILHLMPSLHSLYSNVDWGNMYI